jgi:hypothetical protein
VKIPVDEIKPEGFTTEAGEPIVILFPKSLTEGFIDEFQKLQAADPPPDDASEHVKDDWQRIANRRANVRLFELVISWNVDDKEGNQRPTMSEIPATDEEARFALLSDMPLPFILALVAKVKVEEVPAGTKDFSSGSSEKPS